MPCVWEGNRRSDVALAMRNRLQWFIHLWAYNLRNRDVHPHLLSSCGMYHTYVAYVIFIRCDKHTSNNKHKKQS